MQFKLLFIFLLVSSLGICAEMQEREERTERYSFQPCSSWTYDFNAHGYICSFTGSFLEVPDPGVVQRLQQEVATLQSKTQDLETRLQKLEKKP